MNHVICQFQKDFLRLRLLFLFCLSPLFLKILFFLISQLIQVTTPHSLLNSVANPSPFQALLFLGTVISTLLGGLITMIIGSAIPYVLIPLMIPILIHEDPLVGTTAFWLTRPISRRQLMEAKLLSIGLMVMILALNHLLPFDLRNVDWGQSLAHSPSHLLKVTSMLTLLTFFAVLSDNFRTFIIGILKGWLIWIAIGVVVTGPKVILYYFQHGGWKSHLNINLNNDNTFFSQPGVCLVITFVGLGLIYHQFITRKTERTAQLGVGALFLASVLQTWVF